MKTMLTIMRTSSTTIVCSLAFLVLTGCSSLESRSQKLQLGMTKSAAVNLLGSDYSVAAARVEADGSNVSVLKYLDKKQPALFLYFRNDKLTQWGDTAVLDAMPAGAASTETQK